MRWVIETDKGQKKIDIPESWETLSTDKYIRLAKEWDGKNLVKLFSILSGMEYKTMMSVYDPDLEANLIYSTRFVYDQKPEFKNKPFPETFTIDGKAVKLPKDIKSLSVGQSIYLRKCLDGMKVYDEAIAIAAAIYLQPLIDGFLDDEFNRTHEIEAELLKMPVSEVFPVGFFLLKPMMKRGMSTWIKSNLLKILSPLRLLKRGKILHRWQESTDLSRLST